MGWIESPPFFCAASETGRDAAQQYVDTPVGSLPLHKFTGRTTSGKHFAQLPKTDPSGSDNGFAFMLEVYVGDYIALAVPTSRAKLEHCSDAILRGIHDVFPAADDDSDDPISLKKLHKLEGQWDTVKELLGFEFGGVDKTLWLAPKKRDALLTVLHS